MRETDLGPGRSDADECLPCYFTYIDLVPDGHLVKLLERQISDTERVFEYRALRIARADPVMGTAVEFPSYGAAANFQARTLGDVVAEYAGTARS